MLKSTNLFEWGNTKMKKSILTAIASFAVLGLSANAHEDPRNVSHWHGGPSVDVTETMYPNGTTYTTINNHPENNGSMACTKSDGCAWCSGDSATSESVADCQDILRDAADSGEGTPVEPGTSTPKPPETDKPSEDDKKKEKQSLNFTVYEDGKNTKIVYHGNGKK